MLKVYYDDVSCPPDMDGSCECICTEMPSNVLGSPGGGGGPIKLTALKIQQVTEC